MGADVAVDTASKTRDGRNGVARNEKETANSGHPGDHTHTPITTFVERASEDNRRVYREEVIIEPPSPVKRYRAGQVHLAPSTHNNNGLGQQPSDASAERYRMGFFLNDDASMDPVPEPEPTPRQAQPSDPALHRFRALRDIYLANMLRRDGLIWPDAATLCSHCRQASIPLPARPGLYRCTSCYGDQMLCVDCMVLAHRTNPLHQIEEWDGAFFVASSLQALGLRVQLGHQPGERCAEPVPLHSKLVVLHVNGIHEVAMDACDCERRAWAGPPEEQLQRAGWFPATDTRPRTCATVEMLDQFLLQTYQAKTTMYDYYSVLEKSTNNAGIKPPNRYHAFLRMVREYSHLLMLKRAGRGHAKSGVMGTKQGELAVLCPCCPIPGVNLPDGWENARPEDHFLYILFVAIDACFRLKRRLVSSVLKDPVARIGMVKEMSTCSGLAALDHANTKFSRGYAATGVGMGVCARHEFVQPNGVGDLQKGERYANMDWIAACIMIRKDPRLRKFISYDIVCQWWINLKKRLLLLPAALHIKGHKLPCQDQYSLELIPGSAQTDGEGIERPWAHIGGVGSSTKEMGPGSREDTLNGHWGSWNWQKLVGLGERLWTKRDRAGKEGERVAGWRKMVEEYEADGTKKNPYRMTTRGLTEADVLLEFERDESQRAAAGVPSIHAVSPSSFVAAGLNVEDEQRRVRVQVELKKSGTSAQQIDIVGLRRSLNRSLRRLRGPTSDIHTGRNLRARTSERTLPEDEQAGERPARAGEAVAGLAAIESTLRDVQLSSSLELLRRKLHVKSRLVTYSRCKLARRARTPRIKWLGKAKRSLVGGDAEAVGWKKLLKEDIRCMQDAEELARSELKRRAQDERRRQREDALRREGELPPLTVEEEQERVVRGGESVRQVSWIWTGAGMMGANADLEEALRIEWCKAYARTRRWREEMLLVEEEVRRAGVTLEYRAREWEERAMAIPVGESQMQEWDRATDGLAPWTYERSEGAVAYALKQAAVRRGRGKRRMVYDDEWVDGEGGAGRSEVPEEELEDVRGDDVADDDFILGGGADED
ncbi:hypothetical protein B0H14DRAFT_3489894 [Mycena olivaceomarginata]|nr:hypothetical protein B0H14DRAFT_3489894 [Mycena olivaceomarginata]